MKKTGKQKKLIILFIILGVLLITGTIVFLIVFFGQGQNAEVAGTIQTAQVETGSISSTIEGTGNLDSTDSSAVKIPKGLVVDQVKVQNGQAVNAGDAIATVTKASAASELLNIRENIETVENEINALPSSSSDSSSTEYLRKVVLESELVELEENEAKLNNILDTLTIVAPYSGTISNLNLEQGSSVEDSSQNSSGSSGTSNNSSPSGQTQQNAPAGSAGRMSNTNSSNIATLLSYSSNTNSSTAYSNTSNMPTASSTAYSNTSNMPTAQTSEIIEHLSYTAPSLTIPANNTKITELQGKEETTAFAPIEITQSNELSITAPVSGAIPQKSIATVGNVPVNYTGTITWDNASSTFKDGISYTATIILTANSGYSFADDILVEIPNTLLIDWKVFGTGEENRLRIVAVFEKTLSSSSTDKGTSNTNPESQSTGGSTPSGGSTNQGAPSSSSNPGEVSGKSNSDSLSSSDSFLTTIASIGSNTKVKVNINVDELDILTVNEGQKAFVTLDALENQTFEGTVTTISSEAASGSESIKYEVSVELNKTDEMLVGMSAAATIKISEANDVLTIPVNALQESGERVFVYTNSESNGNLSGEIEVTTGLSDGTYVEILDGLSEGDIVYYTRVTSESSNNSQSGGGPIMNGGSPIPISGGGGPGGGQRPF